MCVRTVVVKVRVGNHWHGEVAAEEGVVSADLAKCLLPPGRRITSKMSTNVHGKQVVRVGKEACDSSEWDGRGSKVDSGAERGHGCIVPKVRNVRE